MTVLEAPAVQQVQRTHLLWAGMASGPLFVALSFAQVPFREGFDLTKHPFSFLLLGPGGWLQSCNFVLAGVLYGVSGVGLRRALPGRTGGWAQFLITTMGTGMIAAGLFPPDPSYGYPEGAPAGVPADLSSGGIVHGLAFAVSMLCWCALLVVLGLWLRRSRRSGWATVALITAVALLVVPAVSAQPFGAVVLYVVVTGAFAITSAASAGFVTDKGRPMRYMVLLRMDESAGAPPAELVGAMGEAMQQAFASGLMIDAGGLAPTAQSTEVRLRGGSVMITDGPYAEAKEVAGGYAILETRSHEEAVENARRMIAIHQQYWPGWEGAAEVRRISGPDEGPTPG